jgi:excisionase family DNA binding protein
MAFVLHCLKFSREDAETTNNDDQRLGGLNMLTMEKEKQKSKLLTVKEVANYLVVTERTVYRLIKDPDFPAFKVGGQWRFKIELIDEWMSRDRCSHPGDSQFPRHSESLIAAAGRVAN